MKNDVFPFSEMMAVAMDKEKVNYTELQEMLKQNGVYIERRRLSEYGRQVTTPPFEKARKIVEVLKINLDEEKLIRSLKLNRELIAQLKENRLNPGVERNAGGNEISIVKNANINLKGLVEGFSAEQIEVLLNERIDLIYGKEGKKKEKGRFAQYVRDLIKRDIGNVI